MKELTQDELLIRTEYPNGKYENVCPKCGCVSLNFLYFSPIKKWLCPNCNKYIKLRKVIEK